MKEGWGGFLVVAAVGIGIIVGLGSYTFYYAKGASYLSNDPRACINCHIMQDHFDSWVKSSHHAVASCNDCHVPHTFPEKYIAKIRNGWNHSKAFTLQIWSEPIRITPENLSNLQHNCLHCHNVLVGDIAGHRDIQKGMVNCTNCHRATGHRVYD